MDKLKTGIVVMFVLTALAIGLVTMVAQDFEPAGADVVYGYIRFGYVHTDVEYSLAHLNNRLWNVSIGFHTDGSTITSLLKGFGDCDYYFIALDTRRSAEIVNEAVIANDWFTNVFSLKYLGIFADPVTIGLSEDYHVAVYSNLEKSSKVSFYQGAVRATPTGLMNTYSDDADDVGGDTSVIFGITINLYYPHYVGQEIGRSIRDVTPPIISMIDPVVEVSGRAMGPSSVLFSVSDANQVDVQVSMNGGFLLVMDATPYDLGLYTCNIPVNLGVGQYDFSIFVIDEGGNIAIEVFRIYAYYLDHGYIWLEDTVTGFPVEGRFSEDDKFCFCFRSEHNISGVFVGVYGREGTNVGFFDAYPDENNVWRTDIIEAESYLEGNYLVKTFVGYYENVPHLDITDSVATEVPGALDKELNWYRGATKIIGPFNSYEFGDVEVGGISPVVILILLISSAGFVTIFVGLCLRRWL